MRFDILTIFPEMFEGPFGHSIVRRAADTSLVSIHLHHLREWAHDKHRTVDDYPYGGGAGMVMKAPPVTEAIQAILAQDDSNPTPPVILLAAAGKRFDQVEARRLAALPRVVFICGHYEGIDDRIRQHVATEELSIGDYVLTGGELAAMVVVDAVTRLLPGVITEGSLDEESFTKGLLEYPQFTRPAKYQDWTIPDVLTSGNHAEIRKWRRQQALLRTARERPDLLVHAEVTSKEWAWLRSQGIELQAPSS